MTEPSNAPGGGRVAVAAPVPDADGLERCPCCSEPTHPEDFRTVNGLRFCAWCDETGCPYEALDEEDE